MTCRKLVAGNWKLHLGRPDEARGYLAALLPRLGPRPPADVCVLPPFVSLPAAAEALRGSPVALGAQDLYWEEAGAFTGEVSAPMLRAVGCSYVLVGHSERRRLFGETDADVARKLAAALRAGLTPILCVGETLAERDAGQLEAALRRQCLGALALDTPEPGRPWAVAYEPVWAIGTGKTATARAVAEAHGLLRRELTRLLGAPGSEALRILYGGSVRAAQARELLEAPGVDGLLVGGACLDAAEFAAIVHAAPAPLEQTEQPAP